MQRFVKAMPFRNMLLSQQNWTNPRDGTPDAAERGHCGTTLNQTSTLLHIRFQAAKRRFVPLNSQLQDLQQSLGHMPVGNNPLCHLNRIAHRLRTKAKIEEQLLWRSCNPAEIGILGRCARGIDLNQFLVSVASDGCCLALRLASDSRRTSVLIWILHSCISLQEGVTSGRHRHGISCEGASVGPLP